MWKNFFWRIICFHKSVLSGTGLWTILSSVSALFQGRGNYFHRLRFSHRNKFSPFYRCNFNKETAGFVPISWRLFPFWFIPLHYRLRGSIGFLNVQKVSKSRLLFLTEGTSKTDNFALFGKIMTQILS